MKRFQNIIAAFVFIVLSAWVVLPVSSVGAAGALDSVCESNPGDSAVCANKDASTDGFVAALVNTLLFIVGFISIVVIIIGGIQYVISGGNASNVAKAKNTITYAIVGLVVSFLAYAIVNWVLKIF